jgi:hypothetical protein
VTIFEYIGDILSKKKGNLLLDEYVPFLVTRWLSFLSPQSSFALNDSVNVLGNLDKNFHYKILVTLYPKIKYTPRIQYVKKIKKEKEESKDISILASNLELSQRETQQLLDLQKEVS